MKTNGTNQQIIAKNAWKKLNRRGIADTNYKAIVRLLRAERLGRPDGISPEHFAAMIVHMAQNSRPPTFAG
jgi:hypothetical protein